MITNIRKIQDALVQTGTYSAFCRHRMMTEARTSGPFRWVSAFDITDGFLVVLGRTGEGGEVMVRVDSEDEVDKVHDAIKESYNCIIDFYKE